jgi:hypothetical protein
MPLRVTEHTTWIEVGLLVTDIAAHGREPMAVCASFDRRLMETSEFALTGMVAGGAVHAALMAQHPYDFRKHSSRSRRFVCDHGEAFRCCKGRPIGRL